MKCFGLNKLALIIKKVCPCGKIIFVKSFIAHRKKYCCKICFYKYHGRRSGLKYILVKENPTWFKYKEQVVPDKKGYIRRTIRGKSRRMHVVIMEEHIGRKLQTNEVVHHINHIKTDNRIENLQLLTKKEHDNLHRSERKKN